MVKLLDDIELRVYDDEDAPGEGNPIDIIELYVHWRANGITLIRSEFIKNTVDLILKENSM